MDNRAECRRRADPPEGHAGAADRAGRDRDVDDGAMGKGQGAAAAPAGGSTDPAATDSLKRSACHAAGIGKDAVHVARPVVAANRGERTAATNFARSIGVSCVVCVVVGKEKPRWWGGAQTRLTVFPG